METKRFKVGPPIDGATYSAPNGRLPFEPYPLVRHSASAPVATPWDAGKSEADRYREDAATSALASAALQAELAATVAERRQGRSVESGPLMAKAISIARESAAQSGHIDHSPGGSPGTWHVRIEDPNDCTATQYRATPTAPPPVVKRWVSSYEPRAKSKRASGAPMAWDEAFQRCAAAARIELAGREQEDIDDATQAVVMALESSVPGGFQAATVPEHLASMTRLRHLAANHWGKRAAEVARLAGAAQQEAADAEFADAETPLEPSPAELTQEGARDAACDLLVSIGLSPTGPAYVLAYGAVRERALGYLLPPNANGRGGTGAQAIIAAELGLSDAAYRQARSRGAKAALADPNLPASPERCLLKLGADSHTSRGQIRGLGKGGVRVVASLPANYAASASKVRAHDAKRQDAREREGTRIRPGDRTPNARGRSAAYPAARRVSYGVPGTPVPEHKTTARTVSTRATKVKVAGKLTSMRRTQPAWTATLSTRQHRYWRTAEGYKRTRAANKTASEQAFSRLSVGLDL